jgi:Lrp/AsnC family leucine-responsive transcriptional regulator
LAGENGRGTMTCRPSAQPIKITIPMKSNLKLDATDRKILAILQANSNITNAQLAKEIGLSPAPTLERVNKLETSGVIKSYHAVIDPASVGLGVSTFVMASLKGHNKENIEKFLAAIKRINEIVECHHITGAGDFILKIVCVDIADYQQLMLERVSNIDVVDSLQSMVILSTFKDSKTLPIPS